MISPGREATDVEGVTAGEPLSNLPSSSGLQCVKSLAAALPIVAATGATPAEAPVGPRVRMGTCKTRADFIFMARIAVSGELSVNAVVS